MYLSSVMMPPHTHTGPSHIHDLNGTNAIAVSNGSHRHNYGNDNGNFEKFGAMLYNRESGHVGRTSVTYNSGGTVKYGFFGSTQDDFAFGGQ